MKLSELLSQPGFSTSKFMFAPKSVIYFKEANIADTKKQEIDKPLYKVISFNKEGRTIGIIIFPKYKFTLYSNGVIIQHPNFKLPKVAGLVTTELSYWSEVHFVTNAPNTMTQIVKSLSDTPNY